MIRTRWGWRRASLETAVTTLRERAGGRQITLVSLIHVGRRDYYQAVDALIAEREAAGWIVLYEGLGSLSPGELAQLTPQERTVYRTLAPLHELYRALARSLDLVFQGEALHYDRERWVNADLPLRELLRRWVESGAPVLPLGEPGKAGAARPSGSVGRTVSALALLATPLLLATLNRLHRWIPALGKLRELLLSDRNRAALDAIEAAQPAKDAIALYGAGHMAGLAEGLERRGFTVTGQTWLTAYMWTYPWGTMGGTARRTAPPIPRGGSQTSGARGRGD